MWLWRCRLKRWGKETWNRRDEWRGGGGEYEGIDEMRGRWKDCTLCFTQWVSFSIFLSKSYLCSSRSRQTQPQHAIG
jgi:hypothetical protein